MLRYKVSARIMRSKGPTASAFALAALVLMAMAAPSQAASIGCPNATAELGPEIKGDITVEAHPVHNLPVCRLNGRIVKGNVTVNPGTSLLMGGTTVTGNVRGNGANEVRVEGKNTIGGNLSLAGTGVANFAEVGFISQAVVSRGRVDGNIEIDNGAPLALVENESVGGSVRILNNTMPTELPSGAVPSEAYLEVEASTVGGNVEMGDNTLLDPVLNVLSIRNTSVANQLLVDNNTETATSESPSLVSGENNIILSSNHVGGNTEVLNNTNKTTSGAVGPGRTEVSANAVTNILNCVGNVPPPVGKENTAKQKLGQCEPL